MGNPLESRERAALLPIVSHPFTLGTVLYAIAVRLYGEREIHEMEPEALALEFQDDFGVEIPGINFSKIQAIITAVSTSQFYNDWVAFYAISATLSGAENPLDQSDPLLPAEMAWAIKEIGLADEKPHPWGPDVRRYVGVILDQDGFVKSPKGLEFADMPERYHGSDYRADRRQQEVATTEHAQVVTDYVQEQSALLLKQVAALPWTTQESLAATAQALMS